MGDWLGWNIHNRHSTWPQSGQPSRYMISRTRLELKLRSMWSMRVAMGQQRPGFGCAVCGPGKGSGRGAFKILDVAMMQSQGAGRENQRYRIYIRGASM
jgi:hypothetical protein